ncbi:hypothetical protein B0H19DRAFT_1262156 [Mycena capillaripes]|nr:hypothetical protein B0H19DRAFT_1262156 [Mycena capillaripes]
MSTFDTRFPNEVGMRVFSTVDARSLRAVLLTSQRFHNLGLQELLCTLVWNAAAKAEANIELWERNINDRRRIPTELLLLMNVNTRYEIESQPEILSHVSSFRNLGSLSLSNAWLAISFCQVLANLPSLTHLSLESCSVANPPPHFPHSFPSFSPNPVGITVNVLTLFNDEDDAWEAPHRNNHWQPPSTLHLFWLLPRLRTLTLGSLIHMPASFLQQIISLSLALMAMLHAINTLNLYLPHTANLPPRTEEPPPPPQLLLGVPLLESFTGPAYIAARLLPGAPLLRLLKVDTFLQKTQDALELIEAASGSSLHTIELRIEDSGDEVLRAVAHHLRTCEDVRVVFRFSRPSYDLLFNLGVAHLRTLHVHAFLPLEIPAPSSTTKACICTGLRPARVRTADRASGCP